MDISQLHLCGNRDKYAEIVHWIQAQLTSNAKRLSFDNLLFVSGGNGIGKTASIKKICDALDLHMVYITTSICGSSDELNDLIVKHCSSSMLQVLLNDKRQKIIVIDEFDSMMSIDRTINLSIYNILNGNYESNQSNQSKQPSKISKKSGTSIPNLKMVPIICIATYDIMKRVGLIKKKCKIIQLARPSDADIYSLLQYLYPDKDTKFLQNIVKDANGNISQCIEKSSLVSMHKIYGDIDFDISTDLLCSLSYDRDKIRKMVLSDPWLIPLKYHENVITYLKRRKIPTKKRNEYYKMFLMNFTNYDILMHNSLTDSAVDIFTSLMYQFTNIPVKKNAVSHVDNFTKILSYLSLQKKYTKNSYTGLYQIGSYHINIVGRNYMFFN